MFGFGRTLVFSSTVGATEVGTAYNSANMLPNVLYEVAAGGALAAVAVPLISRHLARDEDAQADQVTSALLTWAMLVLVPLAVLLAVLAGPITAPFVAEQSMATRELTAELLRWFAPQLPLYGISVVAVGALQARGRFAMAATAPLLSSVVVIIAYLAYAALKGDGSPGGLSDAAVAALAGGTTLGVVALSLPLLVPLRRTGARLRPTVRFPPGVARTARGLAVAGVLGLLAQQAAAIAIIWFANNRGTTGTVNIYQYVQAVYLLPYAVLVVPIATAVFPSMAAEAVDARLATAARSIVAAGAVGAATLVAVAPAVGAFFAAIDAGRSGGIGGQGVRDAVSAGLVTFAPGLLAFGLAALLSRALYVRGRPSAAARWALAGWGIAAALPFALPSGDATSAIVALGIGASVGMTVLGLGLLVSVRSGWGPAAVSGVGRSLLAGVCALVVAGVLGHQLGSWLAPSGVGAALVVGVTCAVVAAVVAVALLTVTDRAGIGALLARVAGLARLGRGRRTG
nr:lipid II flippase MurJ [Arsenicicoccus piscis]